MNDRPRRVYMPWTSDEDDRLVQAHAEGAQLKHLAAAHQRSLGAIKSRLLHLGRIPR